MKMEALELKIDQYKLGKSVSLRSGTTMSWSHRRHSRVVLESRRQTGRSKLTLEINAS